MGALLAFAVVLLAGVLLSDISHRSILSTAVVFLVAGFVLGRGVAGVVDLGARTNTVATFARLALFSVLFTDGMRAGLTDLRSAWELPGRALALGLPLTLLVTATIARLLVGLPWTESLLVGAALSPTDPVFAAAVVSRPSIPSALRELLNVESGLNDGLALPVVIVLLEVITPRHLDPLRLVAEVALGIALGVVVPLVAINLQRNRFLGATGPYKPLYAFAIGLVLLALAAVTHVNEFLAAFAGGVTVASADRAVCDAFHDFGDVVAELLKLAALFVFGAVLSPALFVEIGIHGWAFALLAVVVARPVALMSCLVGTRLPGPQRWVAAWFGPKGFASVVYGLVIADAGFPRSTRLVHLIAATVVLSIVAHSSTDVVVARRFTPVDGGDDGGQ